ncbi:energy-coupling factor transporter ATPase [Numidum massiliense]|uniref:energy-coupling factor transporter ATPase n=1 Tax=Numidum massiliense TaxID=1522315 RepID=UPI0006D55D2E|nr:energy-coupling factor transporter ATPase [Numidum massiliense]
MAAEPLVSIRDICFHYRPEAEPVLRNVDLDIARGEMVAIIGPNGSGKSTLSKIINGLLKPTAGCIRVDGLDPSDDREVWDVRRKVGMVFQNPDNQIVGPTVQDDIAFGLENLGIARQVMEERMREAIARVGLTGLEEAMPNRLSGGQKQRLAIAGVLAMRPELIILDEATAMLDPEGRRQVAEVVRLVRQEGIAVVTVTHMLDEVTEADRIVVIADGNIQFQGTPQEVFKQERQLVQLGLDVPFAVRLEGALRERGVPLAHVEEIGLVNALCKLWQKT